MMRMFLYKWTYSKRKQKKIKLKAANAKFKSLQKISASEEQLPE